MNHRQLFRAALLPFAVAAAGIALVSGVHECTEARIEGHARAARLDKLQAVLPASKYDNDILATERRIDAGALNSEGPVWIYLARQGGQPVAAIFDLAAPDGYNGPIRLLVGVYYDGTVSGVRVVSHSETPGLGDAIEADKSDWILGFIGRGLEYPPAHEWEVARDGGAFDQITGATITSRAVVGAVRRALLYFADRKDRLFVAPSTDAGAHDA